MEFRRFRSEMRGRVVFSQQGVWLSNCRTARVESVAQGVTHEGEEQQGEGEDAEGAEGYPPGVDVVFALAEEFAERRCAGGHAEAEKVQRGERQDGGAHQKRHECDHRGQTIGQYVTNNDLPAWDAEGAGGFDVIKLAVAQKFGAHVGGQPHPAE